MKQFKKFYYVTSSIKMYDYAILSSNKPCLQINNWASACDFQQFDILTSEDSDKPL